VKKYIKELREKHRIFENEILALFVSRKITRIDEVFR
jgi:hypothetical protein